MEWYTIILQTSPSPLCEHNSTYYFTPYRTTDIFEISTEKQLLSGTEYGFGDLTSTTNSRVATVELSWTIFGSQIIQLSQGLKRSAGVLQQ